MRSGKNSGQEAVEFVLVSVLVFFAAFAIMITFGDKIAAFFTTDSAVAKSAKTTPPTIAANSQPNYTPDYQTSIPVETVNIAGYTVTKNEDGSMSFQVAGQDVTLPSSMLSLQDTVFETTGSSSKENLIKEIAYMIETHKSEYPGTNVPVEISYGTGFREASNKTAAYTGTAEVNTTSIKVGSDMVIIQQDQNCTGTCSYTGRYRIEGTIAPDNTFNGVVTSNVTSYGPTHGTLTATIDQSSGLKANNATYYHYDNYYTTAPLSYDWNIDFSNPNYAYKL